MDEMSMNSDLDFRTRTAILTANPDGVAMIGAWDCMKTLATSDPEGCVRLSPSLPMDIPALAGFLRCPEALVEKTVSVFAKLRRLTVQDGLIRLLAFGEEHGNTSGSSVSEEALARKREKNRIRQARSRARKKQDMEANRNTNTAAKGNRDADTNGKTDMVVNETVTNLANRGQNDGEHDNHDSRCIKKRDQFDRCDTTRDVCDNRRDWERDMRDTKPQNRTAASITPVCDQRDIMRDRRGNTTVYNRNVSTIHPLHASQAHKPVSKYADLKKLIPLNELPEAYRNVVDTWNRLPLPKYKGLFPDLRDNLKYLLQRYGETTLCKTIAGIADNAFLLGKKFGKTWSVSLGWLLEPEHFANVLSEKYRENSYDKSCGNAWHPGERLPFYLPGEGETRFTPEEQEQAIRNLYIPTTPAQLKAARLVGLPGFRKETA